MKEAHRIKGKGTDDLSNRDMEALDAYGLPLTECYSSTNTTIPFRSVLLTLAENARSRVPSSTVTTKDRS